jgi:hypothetical protein
MLQFSLQKKIEQFANTHTHKGLMIKLVHILICHYVEKLMQ